MLFDAEGCCMCGNYCEGSGDHVSDCTWTLLTSLIVLSDIHIQSYMIVCYRVSSPSSYANYWFRLRYRPSLTLATVSANAWWPALVDCSSEDAVQARRDSPSLSSAPGFNISHRLLCACVWSSNRQHLRSVRRRQPEASTPKILGQHPPARGPSLPSLIPSTLSSPLSLSFPSHPFHYIWTL